MQHHAYFHRGNLVGRDIRLDLDRQYLGQTRNLLNSRLKIIRELRSKPHDRRQSDNLQRNQYLGGTYFLQGGAGGAGGALT